MTLYELFNTKHLTKSKTLKKRTKEKLKFLIIKKIVLTEAILFVGKIFTVIVTITPQSSINTCQII